MSTHTCYEFQQDDSLLRKITGHDLQKKKIAQQRANDLG